MSQVTDAFGTVAAVGDTAAFGVASAGAKPMKVGTIIAVNPRTVTVRFVATGTDYTGKEYEHITTQNRAIGAFVIKP